MGDFSHFAPPFFNSLPICKFRNQELHCYKNKYSCFIHPGYLRPFLDSDGFIIYFNLPVTIETYLLGLLEQLKCGYCFDLVSLGQLLEKKRNGMKSSFLYPLFRPRMVLGAVSGGMPKSPGIADTLQILLPRSFLTYPQSLQES